MRFQDQNPVFRRFKNLLSPSGRYPEQHVDIFWNVADDEFKIKDVEVVFVPRSALKFREIQLEYSRYNKRWTHDLGNSLSDWLKEYTPASIFGSLLKRGFENDSELLNALREFSHIEECGWAREMLEAFPADEDQEED